MTPTKPKHDKGLMPEQYLRFKDYIIYTIPYNFCVATVQKVKLETSVNVGREIAADESYYSNFPNAIEGLCHRVAQDNFPDLVQISTDIKELKELISNGFKL